METTRKEEASRREYEVRGRLALHKHLVNVYRGRMEHHADIVDEMEGRQATNQEGKHRE